MAFNPELETHDRLQKIHAGSGCCGLQPDHHHRGVRHPAGGRSRTDGGASREGGARHLRPGLGEENAGSLWVSAPRRPQLSLGTNCSSAAATRTSNMAAGRSRPFERDRRGVAGFSEGSRRTRRDVDPHCGGGEHVEPRNSTSLFKNVSRVFVCFLLHCGA